MPGEDPSREGNRGDQLTFAFQTVAAVCIVLSIPATIEALLLAFWAEWDNSRFLTILSRMSFGVAAWLAFGSVGALWLHRRGHAAAGWVVVVLPIVGAGVIFLALWARVAPR